MKYLETNKENVTMKHMYVVLHNRILVPDFQSEIFPIFLVAGYGINSLRQCTK